MTSNLETDEPIQRGQPGEFDDTSISLKDLQGLWSTVILLGMRDAMWERQTSIDPELVMAGFKRRLALHEKGDFDAAQEGIVQKGRLRT